MAHVSTTEINTVLSLNPDVWSQVLFLYLVKGHSMPEIENLVPELKINKGFSTWSVIHFLGFNAQHKKKFNYDIEEIKSEISKLDINQIVKYHKQTDPSQTAEKEAKDIFAAIKTKAALSEIKSVISKLDIR